MGNISDGGASIDLHHSAARRAVEENQPSHTVDATDSGPTCSWGQVGEQTVEGDAFRVRLDAVCVEER